MDGLDRAGRVDQIIDGLFEQGYIAERLLKFIYTIRNQLQSVEAFIFSTRLTLITRLLKDRDVDTAIYMVLDAARDWGSGTRIGEALKHFDFEWGKQVLGQGAMALLISDGLDRGDIGLLAHEMSRPHLNCKRLIWLNPLVGSSHFQLLACGIQTALPFVDDFLSVHNLVSLEALSQHLQSLDRQGSRARRGFGPIGGYHATDHNLG